MINSNDQSQQHFTLKLGPQEANKNLSSQVPQWKVHMCFTHPGSGGTFLRLLLSTFWTKTSWTNIH